MAQRLPDKIYFKIGEVSEIVGVEPYVLRYWETEFELLKPSKAPSRHRLYKIDVAKWNSRLHRMSHLHVVTQRKQVGCNVAADIEFEQVQPRGFPFRWRKIPGIFLARVGAGLGSRPGHALA